MRMATIVDAAVMTGQDLAYAFHSSQLPLRQYFNSSQQMPDGSQMNITVPYFAVNLRRIDATSDNRFEHVGDSKFTDVNNQFQIRSIGAHRYCQR